MLSFIRLIICSLFLFSISEGSQHLYAEAPSSLKEISSKGYLKKRLPTWYPKIQAYHEDGSTKEVIFYEPKENDLVKPVKRLCFYQNQKLALEQDLSWDECQHKACPEGMSISYWLNGSVKGFAFYQKGVKQGQAKKFYENGKVKEEAHYSEGLLDGPYLTYFSNGELHEKTSYSKGSLEGSYLTYDEKGNKRKEAFYENNLLQGSVLTWYSNGMLESTLLFREGQLESNESSPAYVKYTDSGTIEEVKNYKKGQLHGLHSKYYPSSKLSYQVNYQKGQKEGKEEYFSEEGTLLGGGEYKGGNPVKNHIIKYSNGLFKCIALYDTKGHLLKPIEMFYPDGQKESLYSLDYEGQYDKEAFSWYPGGQLASESFYHHGKLEGKQVEYYEQGILKHEAEFSSGHMLSLKRWHSNGNLSLSLQKNNNDKKQGPFHSWYESGVQEIDCSYEEGKLQGVFKSWYENGQQKLQCSYLEDILVEDYLEWYENGQKKKQAYYIEGELNQDFRLWHENGNLQLKANYNQGIKEGLEETFFVNGQMRSCCFFKEGQIDGISKSWFDSGDLHLSMEYEKGVPHGIYQEYYPKGDQDETSMTKQLLNYRKGRLDGEQKNFYPSGQLEALLTYKEGQLHGKKARWTKQGELIHESHYNEDHLDGRFYEMNEDRSEVVYHYQNNLKHGDHFIYYPTDSVLGSVKALSATYENDLLQGEVAEYHEGGGKVASTYYEKGQKHGLCTLFNLEESVLAVTEYEHGLPHGQAIQYYPGGEVYKSTYYEKGRKEGRETTYFPNGDILSEYRYLQGKLNGHCFEKNNKGHLIFEAEYKEGLRHGIFNKYYEDGKPKVLQNFCEDSLHGLKKVFDKNQQMTEYNYEMGMELSPND